jgi:hypothetical protein
MPGYVKPVFLIFLVVIVSGACGGFLATNRGRSVIAWCLLCALFPPLLLVIYLAGPLCEVEGKFRRCANCGAFVKWHEPACRHCRTKQPETPSSDS